MNAIRYNIVDTTPTGSHHVQMLINGEDVGILYLTQEEYDMLDKIANHASMHSLCTYDRTQDVYDDEI